MNRFKIKVWGPYSFENFYYAPDVYIFSLISSFAAVLNFGVIIADLSDANFILASEENVLRHGFVFIYSVVSHEKWWGVFLLIVIAITLPIPSRIGPVVLLIGTFYYSVNIKYIIDIEDLELEIIWVRGILNFVFVVSWVVFKWWYWAGFGYRKNKRKRNGVSEVK